MGNRKVNIPMCLAFILFVLTLISMHLTSGLYARYTATSTGSDGARVAKFDVKGTVSENVEIDCKSNNSGEYVITVVNDSEVAITYDIDLVFKKNLNANKVSVTIDGKGGIWGNTSTLSFKSVGVLAPETQTETGHTLVFNVTDWTYVTNEVSDAASAEKELDFTVRIHAEQID